MVLASCFSFTIAGFGNFFRFVLYRCQAKSLAFCSHAHRRADDFALLVPWIQSEACASAHKVLIGAFANDPARIVSVSDAVSFAEAHGMSLFEFSRNSTQKQLVA